MTKHLNLIIAGRVQNVGFRYHTKLMADALGVYGYVKNMYDTSVYIEIEGLVDKVNEFVKWCRQGPPGAFVEDINIEEGEIKNFDEFKVVF